MGAPLGVRRKFPGRKGKTLAERYWEKVDKRGPNECWPWLGARAGKSPRAALWSGGTHGKVLYAHRIGWELAGNVAPEWPMVIDHTCRQGLCQNPAHMRVVTQGVNSTENNDSPFAKNKAKTHCVRGHSLSDPDVLVKKIPRKNGCGPCTTRICRKCWTARAEEAKARG